MAVAPAVGVTPFPGEAPDGRADTVIRRARVRLPKTDFNRTGEASEFHAHLSVTDSREHCLNVPAGRPPVGAIPLNPPRFALVLEATPHWVPMSVSLETNIPFYYPIGKYRLPIARLWLILSRTGN